jgi:predicted MPP superfamily phosphohydrolase
MASGLHLVNDVHVHVSAGLGVSLPIRVRINCPPEIAIITMHRKTESRP